LENGLLPKNPLWDDKGVGCGDLIIKCLDSYNKVDLDIAKLPYKIKTRLDFLSESILMVASVNFSHPNF
jgi:hypothetical protein